MPAIKPRTTQKHLVRHITRLYRENNETLFSYAAFIGESTEYVLNQLVETVLAKDRDFQTWRLEHPGTHVPKPGSRRNGRATSVRGADARARARAGNGRRSGALADGASWSVERWSFARRSTWPWRTAIGVVGLRFWPFPVDNAFLAVVDARKPWLFEGLAYLYATLWFTTPLIGLTVITALLYVAVMRGDKRPAYGPLPRYPKPSTRARAVSGARRAASRDATDARRRADLADHPSSRPAHGRHDSRRRGHRQDVRVHVSVRRPVARVAGDVIRREDRRPRPGGEGRLLRAGATHPRRSRTRGRLHRDRPRLAVLLQPAAQRPRAVRVGVLDRDAAQQPVRAREGAVLAAGVHRPGQVPDPAAQGRRRLHDARGDLSLRD